MKQMEVAVVYRQPSGWVVAVRGRPDPEAQEHLRTATRDARLYLMARGGGMVVEVATSGAVAETYYVEADA